MTASEKAKARKKLPSTANNWYVNWFDWHSLVIYVTKENSINQIRLISLAISWRNKFLLANILFSPYQSVVAVSLQSCRIIALDPVSIFWLITVWLMASFWPWMTTLDASKAAAEQTATIWRDEIKSNCFLVFSVLIAIVLVWRWMIPDEQIIAFFLDNRIPLMRVFCFFCKVFICLTVW